jgi:rod shape determining protein RodA
MALTTRTRSRGLGGRSPWASPRESRLGIDWGAQDWVLIGATAAIAALGLIMVYSTTRHLVSSDPYYYLKRQGVAYGIGIVIFVAILRIDYRKWRDFSLLAFLATCGLLFFVLTPVGSHVNGAQSWYQLPGGFQFQPSEIAKFGLIVALCGYVNEHRNELDPWRLTVLIGLALIPLGLVQLQPDLGTNMVLAVIVVALLAIAGVQRRYLLVLVLLGLTGVYVVFNIGVLKQYQLDRLNFISPDTRQASAYNQNQSKTTIGSGGLTGAGLFNGPQTRLGFVPEQHTDFIFTAVGEELGFVGGSLLLALFAIVMWRTWRTAQIARDFYGTAVCTAVLAMFAFQVFENIGMTMGIMPVTGIPLPFMSYGGSALLADAACIALVANVYARRFS